MLMAFACYSQNIVITTAYDNLGVEALAYSLNEGSVSTLYTQADLMHIVATIGTTVPSLKHVVYTGKVAQEKLEEMKKKLPELKFVSVEQLVLLGVANPVQIQPPTPDDLCCIMYTSGSTGNPKGVMLKHANMVASVAGGNLLLGAGFTGNDRYLGYLPLAHVLEYVLEMFCIYKGVAIGYGSPRTLTDASVRDSLGDIRELRPTVMAGGNLLLTSSCRLGDY
jgi:long-chain acyl-CoA synthetase